MVNVVEKASYTASVPSTWSETHPDAHEDASNATESAPKVNVPIELQRSSSTNTHA